MAPGTVGSLWGIAIYLVVLVVTENVVLYSLITVGLFVIGIGAITRYEAEVGQKDPSFVVIDEVVGMLVACAAVPIGIIPLVVAFLLFRIFDIIKPFPGRKSEFLPGGWGVMTDDVIAGVYSLIVFHGGTWALHSFQVL